MALQTTKLKEGKEKGPNEGMEPKKGWGGWGKEREEKVFRVEQNNYCIP